MNTYSEFIEPGATLRLALGGRTLLVQRSGAGPVLDITFKQRGGGQTVERVGSGFKASPVGGFDGIEISTSAAGVVDFLITDGDVQIPTDATKIGNDDGEAIPIRTPAGQPLAVLFAGTVAPVLGSTKTTNTDAEAVPVQQKIGAVFTTQAEKLSTLADHAKAVINAGAAQLLISDATFKRLVVKNAHAVARVALGGASMTFADAAIILEPGDTWTEGDAAGAAWWAVSDIAGADVRVLGIK